MWVEPDPEVPCTGSGRTDLDHIWASKPSGGVPFRAFQAAEHPEDAPTVFPEIPHVHRGYSTVVVTGSSGLFLRQDQSEEVVFWLELENIRRRLAEEHILVERQRERLECRLGVAFEVEPVEDGVGHRAEEIIEEALASRDGSPALGWLRSFSLAAERQSFAASTLRCLGRLANVGSSSWRARLVGEALSLGDVELRDAAVHAAESWGDQEFAGVLASHQETEPWLAEYIHDVIEDLRA